jgi:uncharacterized membrane protein YgcG
MSEKKKYSAYSGLGRVAMIWGIPLMPALCAFVPVVLLTVVAAGIFGPGGLLGFLLLVPVLGLFKKLCEMLEIRFAQTMVPTSMTLLQLFQLVMMGVAFIVISLNLPGLASQLGGGVGISSMVGKASGLASALKAVGKGAGGGDKGGSGGSISGSGGGGGSGGGSGGSVGPDV